MSRRKATDTEQLVSIKLRAGTRPKLDVLKKLFNKRSDYDTIHQLVGLLYDQRREEIELLARLLQIELPA